MAQTFYASSKINRHGDYRSDPQILNKIMIDLNTKFVPFIRVKIYLSKSTIILKP